METIVHVIFALCVLVLGIFVGATLRQAWLGVRDSYEAVIVSGLIMAACWVFAYLAMHVWEEWRV